MLTMLAALAQFYSDNLSLETKKGKAERKAQGLYNGLVPFGLKKHAETGLPVPDPETYPGLLLAFQLAAQGKSDREVADALNTAGYRTTGNRGRNPVHERHRLSRCCKTGSIWANSRTGRAAGCPVPISPCSMTSSSPRRQLLAAPTSPDR